MIMIVEKILFVCVLLSPLIVFCIGYTYYKIIEKKEWNAGYELGYKDGYKTYNDVNETHKTNFKCKRGKK